MPRFKATLAYDGTPFRGWQIQPDRQTVQGTLVAALHHLTGESVLPQGAGRTDTGVHALAQVAHFDLECAIPPENLHRALNRSLPASIRVLTLAHTGPSFHARHDARQKSYEYRILPRALTHETICPPMLAPYVWPCPRVLDLVCLNQAAAQVLGTHDFTSFAAVDPDRTTRNAEQAPQDAAEPPHKAWVPHLSRLCEGWGCSPAQTPPNEIPTPHLEPSPPNTRTILASTWHLDQAHEPPILRYRITGTGFLHHMVRNLVGTFTEYRRYPPATIPAILAARDRRVAGPTAPPSGLFLVEVVY